MPNSPLRVLFISHTFPPLNHPLTSIGGMQRVATELYEALKRQDNIEPHPMTLRSPWRTVYLRTPLFLVRCALQLKRIESIDVVIFSSVLSSAFLYPTLTQLRKRGIATVAIAHGEDILSPIPVYRTLVRRAFEHLDSVVAVSRATGRACIQRGLNAERLRIIPNGVNTKRFRALNSPKSMRQDLLNSTGQYLPNNAILLCSVGRHVPRKGFVWFVDQVMPHLPSNVHYWLGGSGPDTQAVQSAAQRHGLQQRVKTLGCLDEDQLLSLYRGSDLYIMPNIAQPGTMEGFGVVMLEAGMCGLYTIASRLEGICDVIEEGVNGTLVPSGNVRAFVREITNKINSGNSSQRDVHSVIQHTQKFGWDPIAHRYIELIRELRSDRETQNKHYVRLHSKEVFHLVE